MNSGCLNRGLTTERHGSLFSSSSDVRELEEVSAGLSDPWNPNWGGDASLSSLSVNSWRWGDEPRCLPRDSGGLKRAL